MLLKYKPILLLCTIWSSPTPSFLRGIMMINKKRQMRDQKMHRKKPVTYDRGSINKISKQLDIRRSCSA